MPRGSREPVRLLATGKACQFRAGMRYRLDAFVRISEARAAEGDIGLWVGDRLICTLPRGDAAAAVNGWVRISGTYEPKATNRDFVALGVRNVTDATVWFDDVRLRVAEDRPNALRLTVLSTSGTEVFASEGVGLRPFQQPLLIVRRHAKRTAFVSVFEPYYGKPSIQAIRALGSKGRGVEVTTDRAIDRFFVSDGVRQEGGRSLSVKGIVGAVSLDRATGALRWLCVGNGVHVSAGSWSLTNTPPATLCLERREGGLVLRTWGRGAARVTVQGPGVSGKLEVRKLSPLNRRGDKVPALASPAGLTFAFEAGGVYALDEWEDWE